MKMDRVVSEGDVTCKKRIKINEAQAGEFIQQQVARDPRR